MKDALKLSSKINVREGLNKRKYILRVTKNINLPTVLAKESLFLDENSTTCDLDKFCLSGTVEKTSNQNLQTRDIYIPEQMSYIEEGDIVRVDLQNKTLKSLYRINSLHNSFLVTERCNSHCIMCSQPPKKANDDFLADDIIKMIPLINRDVKFLGITGGEATLLNEKFLQILSLIANYLPETQLDVLTNGRNFKNLDLAKAVAMSSNSNLQLCIPLYSDVSSIHNFVVQADNAWNETIKGILNLKRLNQKVEIRVVIHKQTYKRLPQLCEFISKNLGFVDHVALMGLEMMGFTKPNIDELWIDPKDYSQELIEACKILETFRIPTSIYNHQLCLLDESLWSYARKSISDWKNIYMPECKNCSVKNQCGGFFASATFKYSEFIKPFS